jgi:7 transmembrane receptor (rhodopsin family)
MCQTKSFAFSLGTIVPTNQLSQPEYQRYFAVATIVCMVLPSIGTVVGYVMVWVSAQRRHDRVGVEGLEGNLSIILTKRIQAAKLSGITAVAFFLTYYPFALSVIVRRGIVPAASNMGAVALLMVLVWFLWSGCCINPLVFGLLNVRYRRWCAEAAKKIINRQQLVRGNIPPSSNPSKSTGNRPNMEFFLNTVR